MSVEDYKSQLKTDYRVTGNFSEGDNWLNLEVKLHSDHTIIKPDVSEVDRVLREIDSIADYYKKRVREEFRR